MVLTDRIVGLENVPGRTRSRTLVKLLSDLTAV